MPVSVTVGPSQRRHYDVKPHEATYLIELAAQIAQEFPMSKVVARYGCHVMDTMVLTTNAAEDVELF
ncbi:MAG TPA: hypothetical protein VK196_08870 [Magnetospirillum sp.]|nr:hypothetical protein [Magnetospirillum sp.]